MNTYLDRDEIVGLTRELVRSPSLNPPGNVKECADIVLKKFKENDIFAEIIEGKEGACNVVARLPGKSEGKVLLLNGHIDVVPPGEGWTIDPFAGEIRDGKIYGRGSTDMKSGIASMMAAMMAMKRSGCNFNGEIVFMAVADEETGSEFGTIHLLKKNIGTKADFAIIGEPTNLRIELGNRGTRCINIIVKGKACHSSRPFLGVNAIAYAAKVIEAVQSMTFSNRNELFEIPSPSIAVVMIQGGTKEDMIPDRCEVSVDRRMIPGETNETVVGELEKVIAPILKENKELQIEIKVSPVNYFDPYLISQEEPIVKATVESFRQVIGKEPEIGGKAGCTDGSHLFHMGKIPAVLFGPGNPYFAHKADEYVEIDNIVSSAEILVSVFDRLLGQ